jgi:hypothetical protein
MPDPLQDPSTLAPEVKDLYQRFIIAMRKNDLNEATRLAPMVPLTSGQPGQESGPLHPGAFLRDGDHHRLIGWRARAGGHLLLRSGSGWYVVAPSGPAYEIVDAGLKPLD